MRARKRLRPTDWGSGGNSGGNEVGTNRVSSWLPVSARVPAEWVAVQRIPDEDRDCGPLGRPPTEPKVSGSNPDGRAFRTALESHIAIGIAHLRVAGWERGGNENEGSGSLGGRSRANGGRCVSGPRFEPTLYHGPQPGALSLGRRRRRRGYARFPAGSAWVGHSRAPSVSAMDPTGRGAVRSLRAKSSHPRCRARRHCNAPFAFTRRIAAEVTAFVQEEARS
jgi:hypothetical protein